MVNGEAFSILLLGKEKGRSITGTSSKSKADIWIWCKYCCLIALKPLILLAFGVNPILPLAPSKPNSLDAVGVSLTASKVFALHGASGDIGFTPKASNINGLRAIEQQYLHQNQISVLYFEGVPAMERFFSCPKQGRESLAIDQIFSCIIMFLQGGRDP